MFDVVRTAERILVKVERKRPCGPMSIQAFIELRNDVVSLLNSTKRSKEQPVDAIGFSLTQEG